jgi:hypothetical protein
LPLACLAIHLGPDDLARLRIERHESRIGLMQEDLAVGIRDAAIDRVAAHDRYHVRILARLIFPEDLAVVVQIQRVNCIWERRGQIHHVANHQRFPFMTAKNAGRERPGDLQFLDVSRRDLIQCGKTRVGVVLCGRRPLLRILHPGIQVAVGANGKALHGQKPKHRSCGDQ